MLENINQNDDYIDFSSFIKLALGNKWLVISITTLLIAASIVYAVRLPNVYKADALLVSNSTNNSSSQLGALASQFGGVASLAGIDLGQSPESGQTKALALLQSRTFLYSFIEKYDIRDEIIAGVGWDRHKNKVIFDDDLYREVNKSWVREVKYPLETVPTNREVYEKLIVNHLTIMENEDTNTVSISFTFYSPQFAKEMIDFLIVELNENLKKQDLLDAEKSIKFLNSELSNTNNVGIQNIFFNLIDKNYQTLMLTKIRDDYAFSILDPAVTPETRYGPNRIGIVILGGALGGILSFLLLLYKFRKISSVSHELAE